MNSLPEPHVERWPLRDCALAWIIAGLGPWFGILATAKWLGWF